jgi:hypothetical protein
VKERNREREKKKEGRKKEREERKREREGRKEGREKERRKKKERRKEGRKEKEKQSCNYFVLYLRFFLSAKCFALGNEMYLTMLLLCFIYYIRKNYQYEFVSSYKKKKNRICQVLKSYFSSFCKSHNSFHVRLI